MVNSPADKMLDCATLIKGTSGNDMFSATGFFFTFNIDGMSVPVLVSNRHVLESFDTMRIHIRISEKSQWSENINHYFRGAINVSSSETPPILHPDPDIDLAILPVAGLARTLEDKGEYIANFFVPETVLLSDDDLQFLSAIENLVMVGCPEGHYDDFNYLPLIRRGITASHPAYPYNGKPIFLSDIACFPGSSGSPIFLYDPFGYPDYKNGVYNMDKSRVKLIGIQNAGYTTPDNQFMNLAIALKARLLLDFKPILSNMLLFEGSGSDSVFQ